MIKSFLNKILKRNMQNEHIINEKEIQKIMEHNKNVLKKNTYNTLYREKGVNKSSIKKNIYI